MLITKSKSLLVVQSELLHSSFEQLLTKITAVLSKQTRERQEIKKEVYQWCRWGMTMASGTIGTIHSNLIFLFCFVFVFWFLFFFCYLFIYLFFWVYICCKFGIYQRWMRGFGGMWVDYWARDDGFYLFVYFYQI